MAGTVKYQKFTPLSRIITNWPEDIIKKPDFLDRFGLADYTIFADSGESLMAKGTLIIPEAAILEVPGIPGLALSVNYESGHTEIEFFLLVSSEQFAIKIENVHLSILITSDLMRAVEQTDTTEDGSPVFEPLLDEDGEPMPVEIEAGAVDFGIDYTGEFNPELKAEARFEVSTFEIGSTGCVLDIGDFYLLFNEQAIEDAEYLPSGFDTTRRGIWIDSATVYLPPAITGILPSTISLEDAFIGSGGFCGTITGSWSNSWDEEAGEFSGDGVGKFLDMPFALKSLGIEFQQNTLVEGTFEGAFYLPFFDAPLDLDLTLTNSGDFTAELTTDAEDGIVKVENDILSLTLDSLEVEKSGDVGSVTLTGDLSPNFLEGEDWPDFRLEGLTITSEGKVSIEGGWMDLSEQKAFDFKGFKLEVTKLGFGNEEIDGTTWNWVGFSGGIEIVEGLPLKGGVEGLKVLWSKDEYGSFEVKLQVSSIYLWFEIQKVLTFDGYVEFIDGGFKGGVDLAIHPIDLGIEAQFMAGKTTEAPKFSYFYIYLAANFPALTIIPPAVGLKGIQGLFGYNSALAKADDEEWFGGLDEHGNPYGFYKKDPEGITSVAKWEPEKGAMAFGLGANIVTAPDDGLSLNANVFLVVTIPGPVIIVEGKAALMKKDVESDADYPFKVLAIIDGESGSILLNIEASYRTDKEGSLVDIYGVAEAYFPFNDRGWHIYLGQESPVEKRIRAELFKLFEANAWLMIDADAFYTGAWIGFDFEEKFGPLKVAIDFWMQGSLRLGFSPIQAKGELELEGNAELCAFGLCLGLSVSAELAAEVPDPSYLYALLEVQLKTPLGNPKAKVKLEWEREGDPGYYLLANSAATDHPLVAEGRDLLFVSNHTVDEEGKLTGGSDNVSVSDVSWDDAPIVPIDSQIAIAFSRPIHDDCEVDATAKAVGPETVGKYKYQHKLTGLKLYEADSETGSWTLIADIESGGSSTTEPLSGLWQAVQSGNEVENTQLLLWASTPFDLNRKLLSLQSKMNSLTNMSSSWPCDHEVFVEMDCLDFEDQNAGESFYPWLNDGDWLLYSDFPMEIETLEATWAGTTQMLVPQLSHIQEFCGDIAALPHSSASYSGRYVDKIYFRKSSDSYLKFRNTYSSNGDTEIYLATSEDNGSSTPAYFEFRSSYFPTAPEAVDVTFGFTDAGSVTFRLFNNADQLIGEYSYSGNTNLQTRTLGPERFVYQSTDYGIRKVEIITAGFRLAEVCCRVIETTDTREMLITLPENMAQVDLYFREGSEVTVTAKNASNHTIISQNFPNTIAEPVSLDFPNNPMRQIQLQGSFSLLKVCGIDVDQAFRALYNDESASAMSSTLAEKWATHTADILSPEKYYYLEIETSTERKKSGGSWQDAETYKQIAAFRTGLPPGTNTTEDSRVGDDAYPNGGALSTLSPYVARTIPEATNPSAPTLRHYRAYNVGMEYSVEYVDQLYLSAGYQLQIRLYDNNGDALTDENGDEIEMENIWGDNPEFVLTREDQAWQSVLLENGCVTLEYTETVDETTLESAPDLALPANTQLTAKVFADTDLSVYSWAMQTSGFMHFRHHLHSFRDFAWSWKQLAAPAEPLVTDTAEIDDVLSSGLEEALQFEQLVELFGIGPRSAPSEFEVLLIDDDSERYGLLLESPEPLDWDRISLDVLTSATAAAPLPADGQVKITRVYTHEIDGNSAEVIELLVQDAANLSEATLEYTDEFGDSHTWYTFAENSNFAEGAVIQIYAGDSGFTPDENDEFNWLDTGSEDPLPTTEMLTLSDSAGALFHEFMVNDPGSFASLPFELIRSEDGASAIILAGSGSWNGFPAEVVWLEWEFLRDAGSELPVLYRKGRTEAETVVLNFGIE